MFGKVHEIPGETVSIPVTFAIHGAAVEFGLFDQSWDDGSYIFCGYNSKNHPVASIAGHHPVSLQIEIIPEGAPERTNPFLDSLKKDQNTVTWYEDALVTLSAAFAFLREFEEKRRFLLDGTLDTRIEKYCDHENLLTRLNTFSRLFADDTLPFSRKTELIAPVLLSIRHILENSHIPDELKYEESVFYLNVLKLHDLVGQLVGNAAQSTEEMPPGFLPLAESLADVLKNIHDDHRIVARGRKHIPSDEENAAMRQILDELAHIGAVKKKPGQAKQHIARELELCRKAWESASADWQTRLDCASQAVELISEAINQMEEAAVSSRRRHAVLPDLSRYAEEINARLDELDKTGFNAIVGPVADRFHIGEAGKNPGATPSAAQDMSAWAIRFNALFVSVTEKEGKLSTSLHLYLNCENASAPQNVYVLVKNGKIREMKPLGR